ncbi:MAG: amidohydrolase family protein [Actinobacteria bacterium]|nr:amidohydrolase family protein [Actinomycetota bacterium]MBV8395219.1 amidohydrolase family protein [Actinomycetota bacterium]MBV8599013.1 amidohydrolase family protein [Actinomycetota bacterium]
MSEAVSRALRLVEQYAHEVPQILPPAAEIFDVHTHLGHDIDGMTGDYDALIDVMDRYGVSRAFMFCLDEPDRHPAFRAANDRTLSFAERSAGRLIPFVRLDLNETPIEEATRCLDAGARGIKLHPRAQRFRANDERLDPVFALAAERRVPILIHGGRGLPPIADGLRALVERHPGATLIVAHAGIADMAHLAEAMAGRKGIFFDTSTWSPVDLLDFYRQVPPEQVLYASDFPYGQQPSSLLIAVKTARRAGYTDEQIRLMLGVTAQRLADGQELPEPTVPVGTDVLAQPLQLARIHQYLSMATPLLWTRQQDTIGVLGLAINACAERDGHADVVDRIRELLVAAHDVWTTIEDEHEPERLQTIRLCFRLIHLADIEAVTAA